MKVTKSLAFVLFLALSGCGSSEGTVSDFIESGNQYFAEGNYDKARIEYKNALQIDPRQAEPYYKMALMDEKKKNWKGVYSNLVVVEQLDPNHIEALIKLGNIYVISGDYQKASEKAAKALELNPNNVEARNLNASILIKQEKYEEAASILKSILQIDSKNMTALSMQAAMANQQGDYPKAIALLDETISIYPDELSLLVMKLSVLEKQKNYQEMPDVYDRMLSMSPDSWELVTSYSQLLNNALGEYSKAVKVLEKYIEGHPKNTDAKLALISLIKLKDENEALSILNNYIVAEPNNYEFQFLKIGELIANKQIDLAKEDLEAIRIADPKGVSGNKARVFLANIAASEESFDEAESLVKEVLELASDDHDALLLLAKLNIRKDNIDSAITQLRTVLRNSPDSDAAHVLLAQAYLKSGSVKLAEQSFQQAIEVNPYNDTAAIAVSKRLLLANDYTRADQVLSLALEKNTKNFEMLQMISQTKIVLKDWEGAEKALNLLHEVSGDTAQLHHLKGMMSQGQGNYENAIEEYKSALVLSPLTQQSLRGLVVSYTQLGKRDELISFLEEFTQANSTALHAKQVLATLYSENQNWDKAYLLLNSALKENNNWVPGYLQLAALYERNDEEAKVVSLYEKAIDANPENEILRLQFGSYYERVRKYSDARDMYDSVLELNPNSDLAANNLASILTDQFGQPEDLQRALKLSENFSTSKQPFFLDTLGWVYVKLGEFEKAKPSIEKAVELAPEVPIFAYHLAVLYHNMGLPDADEKLNKAISVAKKVNDTALLEELDKLK